MEVAIHLEGLLVNICAKGAQADTQHNMQALELSVACLSFDFVGTSVEDWAEDVATLQIPAQWRSCLEDLSTLQLYTDYYFSATPPLSNTTLECLVRCASVRRSLFSSEETRLSFLSTLVNITLRVLQVRFHCLCFPSGTVKIVPLGTRRSFIRRTAALPYTDYLL